MRGLDLLMAPRIWLSPAPTAVANYVLFEDTDPIERQFPSCEHWFLLDGMKSVGQQPVQYFNDRVTGSDLAQALGVVSYFSTDERKDFPVLPMHLEVSFGLCQHLRFMIVDSVPEAWQ